MESSNSHVKARNINGDAVASIVCTNTPESLFDTNNAKKHFSKFGRVNRITLKPKKQTCIIEYDTAAAAERALLNAGAYDGFMFDVTRAKKKKQSHSNKDDDPDWVPDSDLEEELASMGRSSTYRMTRQKPMETNSQPPPVIKRSIKQPPRRDKVLREKKQFVSKPISGAELSIPIATYASQLSTAEAAVELNYLRNRISMSPDDQWRTLEARDRVLRNWGGTGPRVRAGGVSLGTCPDMCPEKERLRRQAEHQMVSLETLGAVKEYSRSSADQTMPMCYEMRPAHVLRQVCLFLLHEVADTKAVSMADWFHFLWDRFRSVRKDIIQQALCCPVSISLVEMCARFHAHCAARLADLDHTQFDQKLNTDNLVKCLQILNDMYADVGAGGKPREAEFRGYLALLSLGDSNFWWKIQKLPREIQKSRDITFAIEIFNAMDNNNYVRFFRLIRDKATYLQACILLRYVNDVRARALARIVKAFAPRGGTRYPANELIKTLAFDGVDSLKSFINHYGLRVGRTDDSELSIILDRHHFIDDSDPYPVLRALELIESKQRFSVGEVIAGGPLPEKEYRNHKLYSSFNPNGTIREAALIAEDQGYNTTNDSNKSILALKAKLLEITENIMTYKNRKTNMSAQSESTRQTLISEPTEVIEQPILFSFRPPEAHNDMKSLPQNLLNKDTGTFSFSKPLQLLSTNLQTKNQSEYDQQESQYDTLKTNTVNIFSKGNKINNNKYLFQTPKSVPNIFAGQETTVKSIFNNSETNTSATKGKMFPNNQQQGLNSFNDNNKLNTNIFSNSLSKNILPNDTNNIFGSNDTGSKSIFSSNKDNLFSKPTLPNLDGTFKYTFSKPTEHNSNIFANTSMNNLIQENEASNIFSSNKSKNVDFKNIFSQNYRKVSENGPNAPITPSSLFKSAVNSNNLQPNFINHNKFHPSTIENTVDTQKSIYDFDEYGEEDDQTKETEEARLIKKQKAMEELIKEQNSAQVLKREEEIKHEEARRSQEEEWAQEQKRQEEIRKKTEEMKQAESKRKAEENKRFKETVKKESKEAVEQLTDAVSKETVTDLLKEEIDNFQLVLAYANHVSDDIVSELCNNICQSEMKAEIHITNKIKRKWFYIWLSKLNRNFKRRRLLEDTPVWLPEHTFEQEAQYLKRENQPTALTTMMALNRGYTILHNVDVSPPCPVPYNVMDIIRSQFLRRMKKINYPYDKCYFWKITLVSPGTTKWINRKVEVEPWLLAAFSDNKQHVLSHNLIQVGKYCWNNLLDFAISVSLYKDESKYNCSEILDGSNALLLYTTADDHHFVSRMKYIVSQKYPLQILPVAVVMPNDTKMQSLVEGMLAKFVQNKHISCYKIFLIDKNHTYDSMYDLTKSALKWLAKNFPTNPPLEIDMLKSLCQRYLGNELWHRLKLERRTRMHSIFKDIKLLVKFYNMAVDKLTTVLTDEKLFNYPSFALEFQQYLDHSLSYPRPYEFIPSNVKTIENSKAIKEIMNHLRLPKPTSMFSPINVANLQVQIRTYCNQLGWFENPEEVVCKVVSLLPNPLIQSEIGNKEFIEYLENYDLLDLLNVVVYEKINRLKNFDNRLAIYRKDSLKEYRDSNWWYECRLVKNMKHKALDMVEDKLDYAIAAKRLKLSQEGREYLSLEDNDTILVNDSIREADEEISKLDYCSEAVKQLEDKIEEETKKFQDMENLLRAALADV